jgi:hypothetical protein
VSTESVINEIAAERQSQFVQRVLRRYPDGVDSHLPGVLAGDVFPLLEMLAETATIGRRIVGKREYQRHQLPDLAQLGDVVRRIEDALTVAEIERLDRAEGRQQ